MSLGQYRQALEDDGLARNTVAAYGGHIRRWRASGEPDVVAWLRVRIRDVPAGTATQVKAAVRRWLEFQGESRDIALPRGPRRKRRTRHALTPAQTRAFLERVQRARKLTPQAKAILGLLPLTGLRISEAVTLTDKSFVSRHRKRGLLIRGKGGHERFVPLGRSARDLVDRYRELVEVPRQGFLFPGRQPGSHVRPDTIRAALRRWRRTTEAHLTPHVLRHTFATTAYNAGTDIRTLQAVLGHTDPATTAIYAQPAERRLSGAVEAADPYRR